MEYKLEDLESKKEIQEFEEKKEVFPNNIPINFSKSSVKGFDQRSPEEIALAEQIKLKNLSIKKQRELERKNSKILVRVRVNKTNSNSSNGFANAIIITIITIVIAVLIAIGTLYFLK